MCVQQVGVCSAASLCVFSFIFVGAYVAQEFLEDAVGVCVVSQSCEEVDAPACAPSGCFVAFYFECSCCCLCEFGCCVDGDVVSGVEAEEV